jgi:hypothetical protein
MNSVASFVGQSINKKRDVVFLAKIFCKSVEQKVPEHKKMGRLTLWLLAVGIVASASEIHAGTRTIRGPAQIMSERTGSFAMSTLVVTDEILGDKVYVQAKETILQQTRTSIRSRDMVELVVKEVHRKESSSSSHPRRIQRYELVEVVSVTSLNQGKVGFPTFLVWLFI